MPTRWTSPLAAIAVLLSGATMPLLRVDAQDYRGTDERLDRVERELNQLQRQVYRNEVGGAPAPLTPANPEPGALDTQLRLDQIEGEIRTLTGQVEELQNGLQRLATKLDKTQADNEVRFQQLEGTSPGQGGGATAAAVGPPPSDQPASSGGFLVPPGDRLGADRSPPDRVPGPAFAAPPAGGGLPAGNATDEFNQAFGLLRRQDYPAATDAFHAFLHDHPTNPLAGNAQYWLGEISFVRADYKTASAVFAEGYSKYPTSQKAPDTLLKLGLSLGSMGQKREACLSFARLDHDFPNAAPSVKEQAARGRHNFGC